MFYDALFHPRIQGFILMACLPYNNRLPTIDDGSDYGFLCSKLMDVRSLVQDEEAFALDSAIDSNDFHHHRERYHQRDKNDTAFQNNSCGYW